MSRADRRADAQGKVRDIKITPRKRLSGFVLVHHDRVEQQGEDGMIYARNLFRVVDPDGLTMQEETPDGPKPVLLMSIPQPVRKAPILASPRLLRA